MTLPVLYSFRRCPYAMRARMALVFYKQQVIVREISLKDKPAAFLNTSPKGTVPVLVLPNGEVIDESLDVMCWASKQQGEDASFIENNPLVETNDKDFAKKLTRYKYFERYPEHDQDLYFSECLPYLERLEKSLKSSDFLHGDKPSLLDIAIFPFIRQWLKVDEERFHALPYTNIKSWTTYWLESDYLEKAMKKYPLWQGDTENYLLI